jgi:hypothetical protein
MSTRDELQTAGEQYVGRRLAAEMRSGVPHYVPGQHDAAIYPWTLEAFTNAPIQVGRVTYVDNGGHACVVLVARGSTDDLWRATWIGRGGQNYVEQAVQAPANFILSAGMWSALAAAEVRGPVDPLDGHR